jgi:hypothetical protein
MADRTALEQRLAKITEHIANGERHIAQQRDIIAELERSDRPADYARYLLAGLEILQAARQNFRSQLLKELSKNSN